MNTSNLKVVAWILRWLVWLKMLPRFAELPSTKKYLSVTLNFRLKPLDQIKFSLK